MKLKDIFFKNECINKKRNRAPSLSNKENNLISSMTTINNKNTLKQTNQNGLSNNINKINMSRCVANQSERNSFKILNNKNSTQDKHTVKEFRKKIIFEKSNNLQCQPVELTSNKFVSPPIGEKKQKNWLIKKTNHNKKKIVFSFNSSNRNENEPNNLQSNQIISNSMLSLSGKSNSKKYSLIKLNNADNLIINFNKITTVLRKLCQFKLQQMRVLRRPNPF